MSRATYVIRDGVLVEKHLAAPLQQSSSSGVAFIPDIQPFRSSVDGSMINSRAQLRDHCRRHDVVPTADLAGLPPKPAVQEYKPDRAAIREQLKRQLYK